VVVQRRHSAAAGIGAGVRPRIRWPASCDHPKCRESATYVPGRGRSERPGGSRRNNSEPGCGVRSQGARSNLADRIRGAKKISCCVTTGRRKVWVCNGLGLNFGSVPALLLGLGVPGFDADVLATSRLAPRCLPASDLPLAFRILAVALVPAPRLVLPSASFAQAHPRARSSCSGQTARFSRTVEGAHGSGYSQGKSSGRMLVAFSSGALQTRTRHFYASLPSSREQDRELNETVLSTPWEQERKGLLPKQSLSREQDREINGLVNSLGTRADSADAEMIEYAAESVIGPRCAEIDRF
jgi:hypothetical protein